MSRETEPMLRTPNRRRRRHLDSMPDVLAEIQRSGSIHFAKALPSTALQHPRVRQTPKLSLPKQFVEENGDKFGTLVTLRVQTSTGRSSKSWRVRVCVPAASNLTIVGGWPAFVADNRLKAGDYLIFVLREDARSEFEVYLFRGPLRSPYFPDKGEQSSDEEDDEEDDDDGTSDSDSEEQTYNGSHLAAPVQQQEEHNEVFTRDYLHSFEHTGNPRVPCFSKRLVASSIGKPTGVFQLGQFEFPAHFIRTHGERVHDSVKLQGIRENSRNYVITCHRRPRNLVKVYFTPTEWTQFVCENDLKEGQVLKFSLMDDSYFVVRKISTCQCGFGTPQTLGT